MNDKHTPIGDGTLELLTEAGKQGKRQALAQVMPVIALAALALWLVKGRKR